MWPLFGDEFFALSPTKRFSKAKAAGSSVFSLTAADRRRRDFCVYSECNRFFIIALIFVFDAIALAFLFVRLVQLGPRHREALAGAAMEHAEVVNNNAASRGISNLRLHRRVEQRAVPCRVGAVDQHFKRRRLPNVQIPNTGSRTHPTQFLVELPDNRRRGQLTGDCRVHPQPHAGPGRDFCKQSLVDVDKKTHGRWHVCEAQLFDQPRYFPLTVRGPQEENNGRRFGGIELLELRPEGVFRTARAPWAK
jgi:hypothetical protein